jgi:hypothetical protein
MMTIDEAAELIAVAVCEHRAVAAGIPRSDFEPFRAEALKPIRDAYFNIIVRAFERGEIRLHSATSLLPIPPALGVGVAILSGLVQADEINRWLSTIGVPVTIEQPTKQAVPDKSVPSEPDKALIWHENPYWRGIIHQEASDIAQRNLDRRYGGTSARDVAEDVAAAMRKYSGFPDVAGETIRKCVLNSQADRELPGWSFTPKASTARTAESRADPIAGAGGAAGANDVGRQDNLP